MVKFKIVKTASSLNDLGKWYVSATHANGSKGYLHKDGRVRDEAAYSKERFGQLIYTGWYKTRELARQAIRKYKATHSTV
jgi:hypothetical protein